MHCMNKKKVMGTLGIAAALMLLAGCEERDIQDRVEQEEPDVASQSQQNVEEQDLLGELSPEQTKQPEQLEQQEQLDEPEQQEQSEKPEQILDEPSGTQVQDKLNADRK